MSGGNAAPAVILERHGRVLVATLDRPSTRNAIDTSMRDGLHEALELAAADPGIAVLVVRGNGPGFCSGGDLREFGLAPSPVRAREVRQVRDVWGRWASLPCVSIAAVHGAAVGGGFEIALLCDLVLCATDARFSLPETALGLIPGVGGTQTLARAVGASRAASVLLAGGEIDARSALRLGIACEVVARRDLVRSAKRVARRIAALDPEVVRAAKASVVRGLDLPLERGLALERALVRRIGGRAR